MSYVLIIECVSACIEGEIGWVIGLDLALWFGSSCVLCTFFFGYFIFLMT